MSGERQGAATLFMGVVVVGLAIAFGLSLCTGPAPTTPVPTPVPGAWTPARAGRTTGCAYRRATGGGLLPDPDCTTGAASPALPVATLCAAGFRTAPYRSVPAAVKDAVYAAYGVGTHAADTYEIDHLVPIEVGGSNDRENLWPQPRDPPPGYREKDQVENWLHRQVCGGVIALSDAQRMIASRWTALLSRPGVESVAPRPHAGDEEAD